MKIEKLKTFCGKSADRNHLSEPFTIGQFTFATNGWIMVRVPVIETIRELEKPPISLERLTFDHDDIDGWVDIPTYELPEPEDCRICKGSGFSSVCPECMGDGEVQFENEYNDYECQCESCYGHGTVKGGAKPCLSCEGTGKTNDETAPIKWARGNVNAHMLEKMKCLDAVQLSTHGAYEDIIRFKFDGGVGCLMPCRI